jgi:Tetratricopeptide repeat
MRRDRFAAALFAVVLVAGSTSESQAQHRGGHHYGMWGGTYRIGYPYVVTGSFPPAFVPADNLFGPQAADRFIGGFVDPNIGPVANVPRGAGAGGGQAAVGNPGVMGGQGMPGAGGGVAGPLPADVQIHGKPRATNAGAKMRAGKFLQFGDALFAKGKYNSALERYREAATAAPDLADSYFREAFALAASSQYESAMRALERGLRMRPNWPDSNFDLSKLYGAEGHLAQGSHREALAAAIEANTHSPDLLVLMGVLLYSDGQRGRSQLFFTRAIELGANAERLLDRFIAPRPGDEDKVDEPAGRAKL